MKFETGLLAVSLMGLLVIQGWAASSVDSVLRQARQVFASRGSREALAILGNALAERLEAGDGNSAEVRSLAHQMMDYDAAFRTALEDAGLTDLMEQAIALRGEGRRRRELGRIAELNPRSPVPDFLIARSFEREGRRDDAIRHYRRALERRPTCAPCHEALGQVLIQSGHSDLAEVGKRHLEMSKLFDTGGES